MIDPGTGADMAAMRTSRAGRGNGEEENEGSFYGDATRDPYRKGG